MSSDIDSAILSQSTESFQTVTIQDKKIVLSAQDVFSIGEGTDFGADHTDEEYYIYAEGVLLADRIKLKNCLISAGNLITGGNETIIDVSGKNGTDVENPNMDPKKCPGDQGGDGFSGGGLNMYVENINVDSAVYRIAARGGDGGKGQEGTPDTAGGSGGNGGHGGSVQVLIVHPYLRIVLTLVSIYKDSNYSNKKSQLSACIENMSNLTSLSTIKDELQYALDHTNTPEDLNASIYDAAGEINIMAINWKRNFQIDIDGGNYGTYGAGNPSGKNGVQGNKGSSSIFQVRVGTDLLKEMFVPFMFVHPSQCAMTLEKVKLMYFSADPVKNPDGIKDIAVLLKRLQQRTAIFKNLTVSSDLSKYYQDNEQSIGATDSLNSLGQIYDAATNLLNNLTKGLDFFGYENQYVPLTSFAFYRELLKDLISNFSIIETSYDSYYKSLKDQKATIDAVKLARQQQESIVTQSASAIDQLRNNLLETGNIIDSYQYILSPQKTALLDKMEQLEDEIKDYFDFNFKSFLSSLTMIAFAPKSALMWVTQIAELGFEGTQEITDSQGDQVNKDYLVGKIESVEATIKGLIEAYSEKSDGTLEIDDPGASKLIANEDKILDLLDDFYNKFPDQISDLKVLFQDYVSTIISRNNKILTYNAIVQLLRKNHQQIDQAKQKIKSLNDEALKHMKPEWPDLAAFVSQMYYSTRSIIMETMDLAARAYGFWALDDNRNLIAAAYGEKSLPEINTAVFTQVQNTILNAYRSAVEKFGNGAGVFRGIVVNLNEYQVESLKSMNQVMISIPVVRASTSISPFAGMCNIRLFKVRVWVKGAKTSDNMLQVNIIHTGKEQITYTDDNVFTFKHDPKYTMFRYNLTNNKILEDGDLGWQDTESKKIYALVGPFTYWSIKLDKRWNKDLDLSGITDVTIEFHGTNYPFKC